MCSLVECVPNFSEGRNVETIEAIAEAIRTIPNVRLLDVDPGKSTNRTVYTIVGEPKFVIESVISAAKVAYRLIDMTVHKGEHKRLGAMDVCPFIPIRNVTMDDCVEYAKECANRLAEELQVPIYLYGFAAKNHAERRTVPELREGEYESLATRFSTSFQMPDYGPAKFVPKWGASIVGARKILIAYNVNLIATKEQANRIAIEIRSQKPSGVRGRFQEVQAMGWILEEHNIAQVTVNILDHEKSSIWMVYEGIKEEAEKLKLPVTGSEIVGLVPLKAIMDCADYYIKKENLFVLEEDQKIHLVIQRLGLNSLSMFDPKKRIIEYMVNDDKNKPLANSTLRSFIHQVGARTSAPGGGSVGAAVGALGAALGTMIAKLSYGKKAYEEFDSEMRQIIPEFFTRFMELIECVDKDTEAFNAYTEALRLPNNTQEEKEIRNKAVYNATIGAIETPFNIVKLSSLWENFRRLQPMYNKATKSDFQVALRCLHTAVYAGAYNIHANVSNLCEKETQNTQIKNLLNDTELYCKMADEELKAILELLEK